MYVRETRTFKCQKLKLGNVKEGNRKISQSQEEVHVCFGNVVNACNSLFVYIVLLFRQTEMNFITRV